jgi:GH24 family phage-related lysozyme (muramidase)
MARVITQAGLAMVAEFEGLSLTAYRDVAGVWTIGYGHTPAAPGEQITRDEANRLLSEDLAGFAAVVDGATRDVPTTDGQFDAMVSLAFNVGSGAFRGSTVLRKHRESDFSGAGDAFLLFDKAHVDGELRVVGGLLRRRETERALYLSDASVAIVPVPSPPVASSRSGDAEAFVRAFQDDRGLVVDGDPGPQTWGALDAMRAQRALS